MNSTVIRFPLTKPFHAIAQKSSNAISDLTREAENTKTKQSAKTEFVKSLLRTYALLGNESQKDKKRLQYSLCKNVVTF